MQHLKRRVSPYKPDFSFLTPKYQKAQVMMAAGITFHRSFELLEAAFAKIPRIPTITKNLGSHFNLIGSVWKICLNIQTWYTTSTNCRTYTTLIDAGKSVNCPPAARVWTNPLFRMTPTRRKMFQAKDKSTAPKTKGFLLRFCLMLQCSRWWIDFTEFAHIFAHMPTFLPT